MAKLGSKKRPIVVRVHTDEKAKYVAETCAKNGWHYIIGFEPDKPEDISDLEKLLNPSQPVKSDKSRSKRSLSVWQREKVQTMLWSEQVIIEFALTWQSSGQPGPSRSGK